MPYELTQKILSSLKGYLDITVTHPSIAGNLIVKGATSCALDFGWEEMPPEMRVDRAVYCCRPAWDEAAPAVFVFEDEVEIVDAPAYLVVGRMIDMMHDKGLSDAVDRLEGYGEPDEWDEE
jgi:hypothetical protein